LTGDAREPLWRPSPERIAAANVTKFIAAVRQQWRTDIATFKDLYDWSIKSPNEFWQTVWSFCGVIDETRGTVTLENRDRMPGARFFPAARLNFAENLLRRRDESEAIVFWGEDKVKRRLSADQLYDQVSRLVQALKDMAIQPGDRIAGFVPNMPETVIATLAAASIGAIWSSCSPDFGARGVIDRFGQIGPRACSSPPTATTTTARPTIR
jgi:acetoacetyl-CoA synthetase